jgi:predicted RNA-binding Zn ribbon-like protein
MVRPEAPGALALVQAFVNTTDLEGGDDELRTPEQLGGWLHAHGLLEQAVVLDEDDVAAALALRESVRAVLLANAGEPLDPSAVETLNRLAGNALLTVGFDHDGTARLVTAATGVAGAFARLLAIIHTAQVDGTWERLKACRRHACRWAYYDTSKNRSGAWCSMAVCGNRTKVRAYQQRRRSATSPS